MQRKIPGPNKLLAYGVLNGMQKRIIKITTKCSRRFVMVHLQGYACKKEKKTYLDGWVKTRLFTFFLPMLSNKAFVFVSKTTRISLPSYSKWKKEKKASTTQDENDKPCKYRKDYWEGNFRKQCWIMTTGSAISMKFGRIKIAIWPEISKFIAGKWKIKINKNLMAEYRECLLDLGMLYGDNQCDTILGFLVMTQWNISIFF